MSKKTLATLTIILAIVLVSTLALTACGVNAFSEAESRVEDSVIEESSSQSISSASVASSSSSTTSSSSRPASSSSSKPASSSSETVDTPAPQSAAPSSSQPATQQSTPEPAPDSVPVPQPTPAPAPQPAPAPAPAPSVDIASVIAQGHAYAAARNMGTNGGAASCFGPIDTTGRTTDSVLADLYAQFDYFYTNMQALPEYDPNVVTPCYNLTSSGSTIYLYFG